MLYIDSLDNNTFRFSNQVGGGGYDKVLPKSYSAKADELNRITVAAKEEDEQLLNSVPFSEITLDGVVHTSAANFVAAFNAMQVNATVTTTTAAPTTTTTTAA